MGDVEKEEDKQQMFPGSGLPAMVGRSEDLSPLNQNEPKASSTRQRPDSPVSSCLSMKTDWSKERPLNFRQEPEPSDTDSHSRQLREQRSDSPVSSCLSMETDWSKERPLNFHQEPGPSDTDSHRSQFLLQRPDSPVSSCLSMETDWSKERPLNFCQEPGHSGPFILQNEESAVPSLLSVKSDWSKERPLNFSQEPGPSDIGTDRGQFLLDIRKRSHVSADERQSSCGLCRGILRDPVCIACGHQICSQCLTSLSDQCGSSGDVVLSCSQCEEGAQTKAKLQTIDQSCTRADTLHKVLEEHKINLKSRCEHVTEGTDEAESGTLLKSIYTELYITEGQSEEVNAQHEVRQLETASKMTTPHDTPIKCHEIFTPLPHQHRHIRVVMTNGVAGVGKTFSVQKFTLDWAEGLENQDVSLLILLSFRELNLIRDKKYSLLTLLHIFHPTLQRLTAEKLSLCKLLFIFDGLDESRLPMDFKNCEVVSDVTQTSSVNVLLANLIKGSLLPSAQVWITSRPAAANQIPSLYIGRITEVRGFTDAQKEQYFRKRFSDQDLSDRMIAHIKSSRSLYIMCLIPVFCWITATVLEHMFTTDQKELPKTLTDMYSHFLLVQTTRKKKKYSTEFEMSPQELMQTESDVLLKLGRLAFEHLEKGNIMFYREDLEQCGLDVEEALVYSGVCTEIFKRECVIFEETVYCFVHLSIQEFLAAVYMFHCYTNRNTVILEPLLGKDYHQSLLDVFLKTAMEKSLKSKTGHLDLFVRFLHGLSLKSNQRLIGGLLGETNNNQEIIQRAINNLKEMNTNKISPDRSINIFHCLTEMNDQSVHQEIEDFLKSKKRSGKELSEIHCSALAYMLQMSEEVLEELDLKNYNTTVEGRRRLIPAVRNCRKALISRCGLSETQSEVVALALRSSPSHLKELDLSRNILQDAGVKVLSAGLESPYCRLETLRLWDCGLTEISCGTLASALKFSPSYLKELELNENEVLDSGVKLLSGGLESPNCTLEILRLRDCSLSEISCASLASAMKSNPCSLKELDLSRNVLQDSGVKLLSVGLEDPYCKLQTLRLRCCSVTEVSCASLASALKSNPFHLKELELTDNKLLDSGVKLLLAGLTPHCRLEILRLSGCGLSENSCGSLASALTSNPSCLQELELNRNKLRDAGVKQLSVGLWSLNGSLKTVSLSECSLSKDSCAFLASALECNYCHLRALDLSENKLQDLGVELLAAGLKNPNCRLKTLRLRSCQLTEISCTTLASAVKGNPAHLRELDLSNNNLQDSGVKLLCTELESPQCKLESLRLSHCSLSNASCDPLVSVLTFNPSHLRELELNDNDLQDLDVKPLSDLVENPHCRLETLHILETMNFFSMKGSSFSSTGVWKTSDSEDEVSVPEYPDSICDLLKDAKPPLSDEPESSHTQDGKASGASLDKHEDDLPTLNTGIIESEDSREQKVDEDQLQPDDREKNKISFTPDLLMDSNKASYRFRCPGPGVYQCAMTGLVFEMAQEAELLYKTAQWDVSAVHLTGMTAAGPLFDIKCSEDAAVTHLHLPHCEIMDVALPDGLLSVAHFTADGMSVIEPHEMTDTHVIVRVSQLSVFGLIWNIVKRVWAKPVKGQILLFLRPSELSVFLLPGNVPLNEVAIQQDDAVNIKVSSDCQLSFGQSYSFHCEPENIPIQPNQVSFQSKFGPNFFTTFQVFLTPSQSQRLTLSILNESRREVWNHDLDLTKAPPTG